MSGLLRSFFRLIRQHIVFATVIGTSVFYWACYDRNSDRAPNILLIMTDQQHGKMMSAAGNRDVSTPAMDFLASEGMRFVNAYCTSPVCGPARSSIITGLMPHQTGVEWNGDSITSGIKNLGEILREGGYETIWGGKWHLPDSYPQRNGAKNIEGFDLLDIPFPKDSRWFLGAETDPALTTSAIDYLENYDREKPLFLALSYHNPHDICMYSRKSGWFTESDSLLEIRYYGFEHKLPNVVGIHPSLIQNLPVLPENHQVPYNEPEFILEKRLNHLEYGLETKLSYEEFGDLEWKGYLNAYNRLTELVDVEIQKILNTLQESGYWDNTVIVFTSDHGDGAAAHKWAAKLSLYEEPSSVPIIVYWPGIERKGVASNKLVSQIDITPTILDVAGVEWSESLTGRSLRPLIENKEDEDWRESLVVELADFKKDRGRKGRMLRMNQYKYNIFSTLEEQLFDLQEDPGELHDLSHDAGYIEVKDQCKKMLLKWANETDDEFASNLLGKI